MESDASDEGKRKRGNGLEEDLFKKSKKTYRSPQKSNDDMLKEMMGLMKGLTADVRDIKIEQQAQGEATKALREEIRELRNEQAEYKKEIGRLKDENKKAMAEVNDLRKVIKANSERVDKLESEKRRKNIIVQGLTADTGDISLLRETMRKLIEEELGVKILIKAAHRLSAKTCLVEFDSEENKLEVMRNKSKLKNRPGDRIFINDDMTKEERVIQKKIRQKANEEKARGKNVKIGFLKLVVDGEIWKWNKREDMLEKFGSVASGTKN